MKFRLLCCWFCWFCQCTLGSERGKTSITHIPSRHAPLSYWHIKCGNRWTSHETKVVALLLHPSYRAMRRFHVQHKAVYSPTDWPNWANPFCLLEVHLVPRLSSYWKSQLPQGRYGLDLCAEAFFILFRSFVFIYHFVKTQTRSTKCTFKVTFFLHVFKMLRARAKFTC